MEVRRLIYLLVACLMALGGCRAGRNTAMLEQELRLQEDRIYQLQDCLQETQASLEACSQENESLRRSLADDQGGASNRRGSQKSETPTELDIEMPSTGPSRGRLPELLRSDAGPEESSDGPSVPIGTLNVTPGVEPPLAPPPSRPEEVPAPGASVVPGDDRSWNGPTIDEPDRSREAVQLEISELTLERMGGPSAAAGDEGLSLVVVPRDQRGAPLAAAAPVSVVVVDPAVSGPAARVARWDFTPEQIATLREAASGEGFPLRLRWGERRPSHKELHLFVRYETADGRKLDAEVPFDLGRLAVVEPRGARRSAANWQRKAQVAPREQAGLAPPPRGSGRWGSAPETPAWRTPDAGGSLAEAPRWNGPAADFGGGERGLRTPQRVAARPERPTWSPDRK